MVRVLGRYSPYIYAIVRFVAGFLFLIHGIQKLFNVPPAAQAMPPSTMFTIIGIFEIVGGLMIMLGFLTSWPAFIASGMLAVGYFMVHQPMGALPIQNFGEPAVLFCFLFLYIASKGSGVWSIDSIRRGPEPETD